MQVEKVGGKMPESLRAFAKSNPEVWSFLVARAQGLRELMHQVSDLELKIKQISDAIDFISQRTEKSLDAMILTKYEIRKAKRQIRNLPMTVEVSDNF